MCQLALRGSVQRCPRVARCLDSRQLAQVWHHFNHDSTLHVLPSYYALNPTVIKQCCHLLISFFLLYILMVRIACTATGANGRNSCIGCTSYVQHLTCDRNVRQKLTPRSYVRQLGEYRETWLTATGSGQNGATSEALPGTGLREGGGDAPQSEVWPQPQVKFLVSVNGHCNENLVLMLVLC